MKAQHIVKVKAPRSGSERLELVLDPNWNVTPDTRDEVVEEDDFPYPELTQSSSRHSYHSESTAETDNRSFSRVSRTYSLESDGSFSRTDFESDAYNEMERRGVVCADDMGSIDEEDEMNYKDVEQENYEQEVVEDVNEYYADGADVQAAVENTASSSYSYEEENMQYRINDGACVIKDVDSPDSYDEDPDEQLMSSAMSGTFDDEDQALQQACSPESDVYDEVYEETLRPETPVNKSFRRGVSFDEETLSKQESTRSQERSKTPIRRMPSEDTSVASVGYRVVQTVKQHNLPPVQTQMTPVHLKMRAASPSILREPKYASNASVSSPTEEKENTPRHSKQVQAPAPILSPRVTARKSINDSNRSGSSGQDSVTSPTDSVHSHSSNSAVRRTRSQMNNQPLLTKQQQRRQQLQQQRERLQQQIEEEKRERLRQQQEEEEEEERLRQEEEELELLRQRLEEQRKLELEQEQYREPLQSIDPAEDDVDRNPWSQTKNTIPKLLRSPSGLSRFSEGMRSNRSTAALDGFAIELPKKPKLPWFKSKKQSTNINKTTNEIVMPKSKTKLMKKFFGMKKKGIPVEIGHDDSENAARHPLSTQDLDPEHDEAPLPSILTSHRPMRVHTAAKDWEEESFDRSTISHSSQQSIRSHNSRHSMGSSRSNNFNHARPRPKSPHQQTKLNAHENRNSNPWAGNATNAKTDTSSKIVIHETANANGSIPTNNTTDGAYNLDGAGMPSFKWWTWSQPDETGQQQQDSRYCAMMCVFPPAAADE